MLRLLVFAFFTVLMIFGAVRVVTARNIVHAAFYLLLVLSCVAAYFILLYAEFLAAVQMLIYAGAVVTLVLFALMLTRARPGTRKHPPSGTRPAEKALGEVDQEPGAAPEDTPSAMAGGLQAKRRMAWQVALGGIVSFAAFVVLGSLFWFHKWGELETPSKIFSTKEIARTIFASYVLPFELVSLVLLAAMVGAIVLAMREKKC